MSEAMAEPVKLYDPCESMQGVMRESAEGGWVDATEYARLEQECKDARCQAELFKRAAEVFRADKCAALKQVDGLRELLTAWRRMFDGGIASGELGVLRGQTDAALSAKP